MSTDAPPSAALPPPVPDVRIVGGGLAGCEAALTLANAGVQVALCEMKPHKRTPAQVSDRLGELVCSNSFRSDNPMNAVGLIKEEMRRLGSVILECADIAKVPAGDALAVDRERFADEVESRVRAHSNIRLVTGEVTALDPAAARYTIVCTGPLTSDALAADIAARCGQDRLAFYDAIAPIIEADSIDLDRAFFKSRYDKGEGADYLNCPMTAEEFDAFYEALVAADAVDAKDFEKLHYFEGCLPIEVMAHRGKQTLTFGPMKPVGLDHPQTGERYTAVLQLRKENVHGTAYNLVGCQTRLKQPAQRDVLRRVPGLEKAVFLRYGAIHRNTYIDAPHLLDENLALRTDPRLHFAGQITGVEGYVESTACGLLVAHLVLAQLKGERFVLPPDETALGGLYHHVRGTHALKGRYQPSNVNWSMLPPVELSKAERKNKQARKAARAERAQAVFGTWLAQRGGAAA